MFIVFTEDEEDEDISYTLVFLVSARSIKEYLHG